MNALVRAAGLHDLDLVVPLFDGYRQFYGRTSDEILARTFLRERMGRKESVIFLAEADGRAVGFTQLYPSFTSTGAARIWILNDLFVDPQSRGRGIASLLLDAAVTFSKETGAIRLSLSTAVTNRAAQALYERRGWKKDTEFLHYTLANQ
ncbi:MAG TPA: GNAT family N-acetyltransferase [Rhizomicrobium sp.]|nr:GNAT family N-acetyltransferase [Rhizomicrobium sp.]